jgi:hypothetical protein
MGKTISTHNGSAANRDHNIRNPKATGKQEHIDKSLSGNNEVILDEKPREAYRRIFGAALDDYNAKQTRAERRIKDYYNHISADEKKHTVYEMIIQVGDRNDTGLNAPTERAVIKEFIAGWAERNPNLELIGAYIHADESNGTLHAHLDYVPIAHGYKNGLSVQNGLVKALGEQGFDTLKKDGITAQIRWESRENRILEEICNKHGIEVEHPQMGRKHLDTPEYKQLAAEIESMNAEKAEIQGQILRTRESAFNLRLERDKISGEVEYLRGQNDSLQGQIRKHKEFIRDITLERDKLSGEVVELEKRLKASDVDFQRISALKPYKTITGAIKGITLEDIDELKTKVVKSSKACSIAEEKQERLSRLIKSMSRFTTKDMDIKREIGGKFTVEVTNVAIYEIRHSKDVYEDIASGLRTDIETAKKIVDYASTLEGPADIEARRQYKEQLTQGKTENKQDRPSHRSLKK